jgi:hypothetical protein
MVVAGEAMEEGNFTEVSRWLRLGARIADEIDDIIYDVERNKDDNENTDGST